MPDPRDTPAMRQYYRFKRQHPDCVLFFRIGDFYELFDDDAVKVSRAIGLTLTQRTEGVPMCGAPYHQLETYLRKAIDAGFRVAVCDQTQDAAEAKAAGAVIERAVTRVLTPGTLVDESLLESDAPSMLAAASFLESGDESASAAAVVDLSTGRFEVFRCATVAALVDELARRRVTELVYSATADGQVPKRVERVLHAPALVGQSISGTPQPSWHFRLDEAREALLKQFGVRTLDGFGLADDDAVIAPAGAIIRYLQATQMPGGGGGGEGAGSGEQGAGSAKRRTLGHIQPPRLIEAAGACVLDATTLRSLEICRTIRATGNGAGAADAVDGSLLGIFAPSKSFAGCATVMGRRLLREWLCRPLYDLEAIARRQSCIATLVSDRQMAARLCEALKNVQDIARIAGRLALGRATPRDLGGLGCSLKSITPISEALENAPAFVPHLETVRRLEAALSPLGEAIAGLCVDAPPGHMREGGLIRDGADAELDEARRLQRDAAGWMAEYQAKLIAEHDLPSLKVGYNKIFGYYIELPAAQSRRAPDQFTRKQTLKNAERYITPELKEFETKVLSAESRALAREVALFESLCDRACALIPSIGAFADVASELDVLGCLAEKACKRRWVKPELTDRPVLVLRQARHPVLDEKLDGSFVPNDVELGSSSLTVDGLGEERPSLALITGPNMAGKSTFIRTAALVTLLAHVGSFVPADAAVVGLTDRIFTRIGADDALHAGQSTFMVEMTETARILNHCTARSLVILDEIGRGTSTLDGLSLAWAIAETLGGRDQGTAGSRDRERSEVDDLAGSHDPMIPRSHSSPRTLFATHYHELTDLQELLPGRVQNLHVAVREWGEEIVFLHRILPGRTDQSYGIHVAKLAGLPGATIARAREVLESIAVHHQMGGAAGGTDGAAHAGSNGAALGGNGKGRRSSVNTRRIATSITPPAQLSLFTEYVQHPVVDELREMKLDALTPLQAFDALRRLYELTRQTQAQR